MEYQTIQAALITKRDALTAAIDALAAVMGDAPAPVPALRSTPTKAKAGSVRKVSKGRRATPANARAARSEGSKVQQYGAAIVKWLGQQELSAGDGVVIRRAVAKAYGVDDKKDESFSGDMGNALQRLKKAGTVTRKGTMWTLTDQA